MNDDIYPVLAAYEDAAKGPGGTRLEVWLDQYPQFRDELIDYAMMTYLFDHATPDRASEYQEEDHFLHSADVVRERMMSDGPYSIRSRTDAPLKSLIAAAKERELDVPAIAERLKIGLSLVVKLDRRMIDPATIPQRIADGLAELLARPVWEIAGYLQKSSRLSTQASYQAKEAPRISSQQDFLKALDSCVEVPDADKASWRDISRAEPHVTE